MINKCGVCYLTTGCKKLLGKVRKFGRSVHTLIHPPSQCDCYVQQTQLKNVKMQDIESIQSYFTRVSQIREQIEVVGDLVEEAELVMTTMNGLPRSWDPFIKGICSRRKLMKFSKLWEDCTQEEARLEARE